MLKKLRKPLASILFLVALVTCFSSCGKGACLPRTGKLNKITMSLGTMGRFGNWVYQYLFLKVYAKRHGLQVETTDWVGRDLYGANDPGISDDFCEVAPEGDAFTESYKKTPGSKVVTEASLTGYFQIHTSGHIPDKDYILSLFTVTPEVKKALQPAVDQLKKPGTTLVAIHLRRGDFGKPPFVISPSAWYLTWLAEVWPTLTNPVLFIASDDIDAVVKDFAKYNPKTIRDLNVHFPKADYFPEHYILTQADVLAISNSSFSSSAALFNQVGKSFVRPDFDQKKMVSFDPWSTWPWESWH